MSDYSDVRPPQPQGSGIAITGMVLGILSLIPCLGVLFVIPGIIFSAIGLGKASKGTGGGMGFAVAGLTCSIVACLLMVPIGAGMFLPALNSAREKARRITCATNMKQIGLACKMYAIDNNDYLPPENGMAGLNALYPKYIDDPKIFVCPSCKTMPAMAGQPLTEANCDYIYFGGKKDDGNFGPDEIVVTDKDGNHPRYGNILFLDGHVTGYAGANWSSAGGLRKTTNQ